MNFEEIKQELDKQVIYLVNQTYQDSKRDTLELVKQKIEQRIFDIRESSGGDIITSGFVRGEINGMGWVIEALLGDEE